MQKILPGQQEEDVFLRRAGLPASFGFLGAPIANRILRTMATDISEGAECVLAKCQLVYRFSLLTLFPEKGNTGELEHKN